MFAGAINRSKVLPELVQPAVEVGGLLIIGAVAFHPLVAVDRAGSQLDDSSLHAVAILDAALRSPVHFLPCNRVGGEALNCLARLAGEALNKTAGLDVQGLQSFVLSRIGQ